MQPVKLGEGPEALVTRADAEPSPRKREGRCREQTAGTYSLNGHGDGVLQTTNPRRVRPGRRKPKWQENPPPLKACRFDSDLGQTRLSSPRADALPSRRAPVSVLQTRELSYVSD